MNTIVKIHKVITANEEKIYISVFKKIFSIIIYIQAV